MIGGPIVTELRLPTRLGFEKVAMSTAARSGVTSSATRDLRPGPSSTSIDDAAATAINTRCASRVPSSGMSSRLHTVAPTIEPTVLAA